MTGSVSRWAWADVDLDAVAHNVGVLRVAVAPADVWAVVKADGYGHGAVAIAKAALTAGAAGLCVALTSEGIALRAAGIDAPILVLSEQPGESTSDIVDKRLIATVTSRQGVDALASAAVDAGRWDVPVHVKVDTGMHRVGTAPADCADLVDHVAELAPTLAMEGIYTHLAVADELDNPYTSEQLARFEDVLAKLDLPDGTLVHAANSAAALAHPAARYSLVRAGIAIYGISPGPELDDIAAALRPALALKARVSHTKRLRKGDRISYGLRHTFGEDATVATIPIGYADGVRRNLSGCRAAVLVGGKFREIVGTITMDQLMVDCRDDDVAVGDEVVLIGRQGDEEIRAEDWAATLGTIGYEVVCGIGSRIPRRYVSSEGLSANP
jgi:alanine racemase